MGEYDFCEELKEVFENDVFTTPTIDSLINGFVKTMGMNLETGETKSGTCFISKEKEEEYKLNLEYFINYKKHRVIWLSGNYNDFEFKLQCFFNYPNVFRKNIIEIPFFIELVKKLDNNDYKLVIVGHNGETTIRVVRQDIENKYDNENIQFYCKRMDLENVLGLISSFLAKPTYLLEKYREIYGKKKVYFTNSEVDTGKFDKDFRIDDKGHLLQKVLK